MKDSNVIALAIPLSWIAATILCGIVAGVVKLWLRLRPAGLSDPCHTINRDPYTKQADFIRRREREG